MGCPPPPYIKEPGGRRRPAKEGAPRGSPSPTGSRTPFFPSSRRRSGKEEEEGKERGGAAPPPLLVLFVVGRGGVRPALAGPPLLPHGPCRPNNPLGVPVTSRYPGKIPISPGTIPISKYRLPIYRSLCLDHFETPSHGPDLIRDSELLRYIKTHKLII